MAGAVGRWSCGWVALALGLSSGVSRSTTAPPPTLIGRWAVRQTAFMARRPLPDSLQEKLFDSPVAATSEAIRRGRRQEVLEFRADSTYAYTITEAGHPPYAERGRFSLRQGQLRLRGTVTGSALPARLLVTYLAPRRLLLETPLWAPVWQVSAQVVYRRLP